MVETASHTWACPACGRRVPLRADTCHCGMTQERAGQLAASAAAPTAARPARPARPGPGAEAVAAMTRDVKVFLVAGALVVAAGLGWLVFSPSPQPSSPPVLGFVDKGAPPPPKPKPSPRPPFRLPWWK